MQYWTKDLLIDPSDSTQNRWYACVFSGYGGSGLGNNKGGLYKTTNRGQTWSKVVTNPTILNVESCTISPTNSSEMYFSTELDGLWYTSNLNAGSPTFAALSSYPFYHPMRILFNPFDTTQIWVTNFGNGLRVGTVPAAGITNSFFYAE
jgi:hypothetical protein